jgi:hypothetical protein
MKSFTMKALAVAVLGLAGVGSAMAACPTDPAAPAGPWASKSVSAATLSICPGGASCGTVTSGMNGTNCALVVGTAVGASALAKSFVTDTSPNNEPRYRMRVYFDVSALVTAGFTSGLKQVKIYDSASTTSPANTPNTEVGVFLAGGSPPSLKVNVANSDSGSAFTTISIPLTGGTPTSGTTNVKRFEFDLQQGASSGANCASITPTGGCFRYWLSDDTATTADATPNGTLAVTNTGWSGVKQTSVGILTANPSYRLTNGSLLEFDEFDSRRQTFIGK